MAMMMTASVLGLHVPKNKDVVVKVKADGKTDVSDALQKNNRHQPQSYHLFPRRDLSDQQTHSNTGLSLEKRRPRTLQLCHYQGGR